MKRAILYARVSGEDRSKDRRNLGGQLAMCRAYARQRGYRIVAWLHEDDRGALGASWDLPQLSKALDLAQAGEFDVLITRELDRLARDLAKQLFVESEFKRAGVAIEYVLGKYPDTPEGNLTKNVRAIIAEYERLKIAERTKRAKRAMVTAGDVITAKARPPYGYRCQQVDGRRNLVIYEEEARVVRTIYELYTGDRRMGLNAIARYLSDLCIPTWADIHPIAGHKVHPRGRWGTSSLRSILVNETYTGVWYFGKRRLVKDVDENGRERRRHENNPREHWIAVPVPAIVERATWDKAQRRMVENRHNYNRETKYDYLMRRQLTCDCGLPIVASTRKAESGKMYKYYRCAGAANPERYRHRPCDLPVFQAADVDAVVWTWLKDRFTPERLARGLDTYQAERDRDLAPIRDRISALDEALTEKNRQLERLLDLYLTGEFSQADLLKRKHRMESSIGNLERERAGLAGELEGRRLTSQQVQSLSEFAREFAGGLAMMDRDFSARRRVVETLDVRGRLAVEGEQKVIHVSCILGEGVLHTDSATSGSIRIDLPMVWAARLVLKAG